MRQVTCGCRKISVPSNYWPDVTIFFFHFFKSKNPEIFSCKAVYGWVSFIHCSNTYPFTHVHILPTMSSVPIFPPAPIPAACYCGRHFAFSLSLCFSFLSLTFHLRHCGLQYCYWNGMHICLEVTNFLWQISLLCASRNYLHFSEIDHYTLKLVKIIHLDLTGWFLSRYPFCTHLQEFGTLIS